MFPPVDEAVLRNNPDFASLYGKLTNVILEPDGSTRDHHAGAERAAVQKDLEQRRLVAAKHHLLARAISSAVPPETPAPGPGRARKGPTSTATALPEPLLDLLLLLPPLLAPDAPPPSPLLLASPPLADLETLLPDLAALVSASLHASVLDVARVAHPSTNPSYLHRHVAGLARTHADLTAQLRDHRRRLSALRHETLAALTALLDAYAQALTHLIRALEAKHGIVARSLELRAAHVQHAAELGAAEAEQMRWALTKEIYTPQTVAALRNYQAHLKDARSRTAEKVRGLEDGLAEYGVGVEGGESKEKTMREMARIYRDMRHQIGDVQVDLDRLQKG